MSDRRPLAGVGLLLALSSLVIPAAAQGIVDASALFDLSLEELLDVKMSTAGGKPEEIREIPASVVVISRQEIERYGYTSLSDVLRHVTGLYVIDDYAYGPNFGIRGFWNDLPNKSMAIMVNGIRRMIVSISSHWFVRFPVPIEAIDRIEVVRGPMSILYGSGAFFGAINIYTTNPRPLRPIRRASVAAGSQDTYRAFGRMADERDRYRYVVNAGWLDSRGIDADFRDLGAAGDGNTGGTLEGNERYFSFRGTFEPGLTIDVTHSRARQEMDFLFPAVEEGTAFLHSATDVVLGLRRDLSSTTSLSARLHYYADWSWWKYDILFPGFFGLEEQRASGIDLELSATLRPMPAMGLTTGLNWRAVDEVNNQIDLPGFAGPSLVDSYYSLRDGEDLTTRAAYAQADLEPSDRLRLVAGVRLEQLLPYRIAYEHATLDTGRFESTITEGGFNRDDVHLIPRAAVVFELTRHQVLKFLYGQAVNFPAFHQVSDMAPQAVSNNLDPERVTTYELNYLATISSKFALSGSLFYNDLDDLIRRSTGFNDEGVYFSRYDNTGDLVTKGAELAVQIRPLRSTHAALSASWQEAEDKNREEIAVGNCPEFLVNGRLSIEPHPDVTLAVTAAFVDRMLAEWDPTPEDPTDPESEPRGRYGHSVDGYVLLGANIRLERLARSPLFLSVRVSNLLDEQIRYPTTTNSTWAPKGTLGPGVGVMVTTGVAF